MTYPKFKTGERNATKPKRLDQHTNSEQMTLCAHDGRRSSPTQLEKQTEPRRGLGLSLQHSKLSHETVRLEKLSCLHIWMLLVTDAHTQASDLCD